MEKATFGAGCFWGVESFFRGVPGVTDVVVGYAGGSVENPTYRQVCSDTTGHAEVVQITYDPAKVNYDRLLDVFFANHDPTTLNRQGPDYGSQYRSVVFAHSPEQERQARTKVEALTKSGRFKAADCHRDRALQEFLSRRGLSPTLFREERTAVMPRHIPEP